MKTSCVIEPRSHARGLAHPSRFPLGMVKCSVLLLFAAATTSTWAQSITMRSQPLRLTIAKGVVGTNVATLTSTTTGFVAGWNLSVTGVPSGAGASLSQTLINSNGTTAITLTLINDTSVAAGNYDMAVLATGDSGVRLPIPVEVAYVWSGVNFTNAVSTNFSSAGNWKGGVVPGATDPVVFNDGGGQAATTNTNIVVSANQEVASVRFGPEGGTTRSHNLEIQNGATLKVTGPGLSFSLLRDSKLVAQQITTTISGAGTLLVSNATANIGVLLEGQQNATLDLRNLNNFVADVVRIGLGDYRMYPNYYTNGYTGPTGANLANPPTRFVPLVWLAKTNLIKASWVDPNNYNDPGIRDYALTIGNDEANGTTANIRFTLGNSNVFLLDSICWAQSGKGGGGNSFNFNTSNSYASFRGIGGGRMSVWAQGDAAGTEASQTAVRGTIVDLSNGQVDALVDRLYLGRNRTNTTGMTIQGTLTVGGASLGSVFDVNTAYLGAQDVLNLGTGAGPVSGPVGTLNVNSNAIFNVNGTLHLGYTIATTLGVPDYPENCSGLLNINNTGTVMASNIVAGGVSKRSVLNNITMNRGRLTVTNGIGSLDGPINIFTMTNGSTLTLHNVGVGRTNLFVRTLAVPSVGPASVINIPTLANVSSYPVTISVISYVTASPNLNGLTIGTLPPGVFLLSVLDNPTTKTIDFTFSDVAPKVLVWRGNIDNNWDTTTKNWVTLSGGLQTNFNNGDSVIFDDTALSSTVNVNGTVVPGQGAATFGIAVNNSSSHYTFNGGSVSGSSTLLKTGPASLTVNASFTPGVIISQGSLLGVGGVGPTVAQSGTTMTGFSGTITGGLTASNATVSVSGIVNGGLAIRAGSVTNNGTINSTISLSENTILDNANIINVTVPWSIPTNSTVANNGTIVQSGPVGGNAGLTVNGTLRGVGKITQTGSQASSDVRVTMGSGGALIIGNSPGEITTMTIATRLDFNAGSTTTFDANTSSGTSDQIFLTDGFITGKVNFGANSSLGGTFVINKVAGPAFTLASQLCLFNLCGPNVNTPDNTIQARPQIMPAPAPGLVWDISQMLTNLTLKVTGPPTLSSTSSRTNIVFTWPDTYRGWRLEAQTNALTVGISTNWGTVGGSFTTNSIAVPIVSTNPTVFYRLAFP